MVEKWSKRKKELMKEIEAEEKHEGALASRRKIIAGTRIARAR